MGFINLADCIKYHLMHQWLNMFSGRTTRAQLLSKSSHLRNAYQGEMRVWFHQREQNGKPWLFYPSRKFD